MKNLLCGGHKNEKKQNIKTLNTPVILDLINDDGKGGMEVSNVEYVDGPHEFVSPSSNWSHKNNILTLPYVPKIGNVIYKITYKCSIAYTNFSI